MPLTLHLGRLHWSATWPMTLLTLLAALLFVDLGRWQWHRANAARALDDSFRNGSLLVTDLGARATASLPRYTQVRASGHYDDQHQFLLDNMSHDGAPGYEVLTPLQLDDGRSLLVNRGWIPITASRSHLPAVDIGANAEQIITGRLDQLPVAAIALGHVPPDPATPWPKLTSFPIMPDLSAAFGKPLQAQQLLLDPKEPLGYVRDWHPGGIGVDRHLSYAVQWWLFAALALGLYGWLNRRPHSA